MTRTKLHTLADVGQSVWLDYIQRSLITSGGLQTYINKGLRGITSNPSLFEKAIADSNEYDDQIQKLALLGKSAEEIYEELTVEDARMAADVLRPVFDETDGNDGYFSLEVSPHLANDRQGTINEAIRLLRAGGPSQRDDQSPGDARGRTGFSGIDRRRHQHQCDFDVLAGTVRPDRGSLSYRDGEPCRKSLSSEADRFGRLDLCQPAG